METWGISTGYNGSSTHDGNDFYALDFNINGIADCEKSILSIAPGTVEHVGWDADGYRNYVKVDHGDGFVSLYAHFNSVTVELDQRIAQGQELGKCGNTGSSSGCHLHFELEKNGVTYKPEPMSGYTDFVYGGSYVSDNVYNPVGYYFNGFHTDGTSQAFIDAYNHHPTGIGWPIYNNGGDVFVHKWESDTDSRYRVWLQDFVDENDEHTALVLNEYNGENKAYLLQYGFRDLYMNNDGPYNYGMPFTNEIIHGYANSPDDTSSDTIQPGNYITVQKFRQIYEEDGGLVYNNHRKTMVWQDGVEAQHFAVGEFTVYACNEFQNGEQVYVINNEYPLDPFMDIPWPIAGITIQNGTTGKWFTKTGDYNFVVHNPDGSRKQGSGLSVLIAEGNAQFAGDAPPPPSPPNYKVEAFGADGIAGWNQTLMLAFDEVDPNIENYRVVVFSSSAQALSGSTDGAISDALVPYGSNFCQTINTASYPILFFTVSSVDYDNQEGDRYVGYKLIGNVTETDNDGVAFASSVVSLADYNILRAYYYKPFSHRSNNYCGESNLYDILPFNYQERMDYSLDGIVNGAEYNFFRAVYMHTGAGY